MAHDGTRVRGGVAQRPRRRARARAERARFAETKTAFSEFLRRPDEKMSVVRSFQKEFNEIDLDHRRDPRTVGELLVRADELRDALWDVCDERLAENVAERGAVAADTWAADHAKAAVAHYCALVQLELDKFAETAPVLADYFAARRGEPLPEDGGAVVRGGEAGGGGGRGGGGLRSVAVRRVLVRAAASGAGRARARPFRGARGRGGRGPKPETRGPAAARALAGRRGAPRVRPRAGARPADERRGSRGGGRRAGGSSSASAEEDPDPVPGPPAPALAAALAAALEYVRAYAPEEAAAEGGNEAEETSAEAAEAGASSASASAGLRAAAETAAAMREERAGAETRLERIADRCATHVAELSDVARLCHARLAEMVKTKYKAECGAVAALAEEVKMAAENATPLEKDLNLTVSNDVLVVAEEETAIPPPPPFPAPPPASRHRATRGRSLVPNSVTCARRWRAPRPRRHHPRRVRLGDGAAGRGGGRAAAADDADGFSDRLPPRTRSRDAAGSPTSRGCSNLATRRTSSGARSSPRRWRRCTPSSWTPPAETIAAAAAQPAPRRRGEEGIRRGAEAVVPAVGTRRWVSRKRGRGRVRRQPAHLGCGVARGARAVRAKNEKRAAPAPLVALRSRRASGDVSAAAVMAGLAEAFGAPGADGEVDITMLALHLCVSATPELGAGKAVAVARWLTDPEAERGGERAAERAGRRGAGSAESESRRRGEDDGGGGGRL